MEDYFIANSLWLVLSWTLCVVLYWINCTLDKLKQEADEKNEERYLDSISTSMYLSLVSVCYSKDKYDGVSLRVITDIADGKEVY